MAKEVSEWRRGFAPDQRFQRIRPRESKDYILNPHKGTTTFQRFNGDPLYPDLRWHDDLGPVEFKPFDGNLKNPNYPDTTISYCRWLWSVIEPEKGKYRWDIIDGALEAARLRGQTLQVRIQPYIMSDAPKWYWNMGGKAVKKPYRDGVKEIDHNIPAYYKHWGDLLRAFAAKYDGHPDLESFDVAYGGPCGECGGNCTTATAERLARIYLDAFKKTQLVLMLNTDGARYAAKKKGNRYGWRGDCIGDLRMAGEGLMPDGVCWNHMYDEYPHFAFADAHDLWKTGPVTLETCWVVGHWYEQHWDIDWILEQALKYHPSVFMPKSCYIPEAWTGKINEFNKRMGYRFVLRQLMLPLDAKPGQRIEYTLFIDNMGVAPIYRPYQLALRFRQEKHEAVVVSKQDIRTWLPDHTWFAEKITFPRTLGRGVVHVDIGIVDPATGKPRVRFAIQNVLADGWHPMTCMDVV